MHTSSDWGIGTYHIAISLTSAIIANSYLAIKRGFIGGWRLVGGPLLRGVLSAQFSMQAHTLLVLHIPALSHHKYLLPLHSKYFQITFKNFLRRDWFRRYFSIHPVVPYLKIFDEACKKAINILGSFHGPSHRIQLSRAHHRPDVKHIMSGRYEGSNMQAFQCQKK
jgi:hypothetical protein